MRSRLSVALALMLAAGHAAGAPTSKSDRELAREHFAAGTEAFEGGQYDAAVAEYRQAYDLTHAPALLFNIAQAYRKKGASAEALDFYKRYLRDQPAAKNRSDVEQLIAELEATERAKPVETPPVDKAPEPSPSPPPVVTPAPPAPPAPAEPSAPSVVETAPAPAAVDTGDHGAGLRRWGIITMSAGGVLAATSVVLFVGAHSAQSSVNDKYHAGGTWTDDDQSTYDRGKLENNLGIAAGVAAGAAVAGGALLYYLGARRDKVDMAFVPAAGGGNVVVKCAF